MSIFDDAYDAGTGGNSTLYNQQAASDAAFRRATAARKKKEEEEAEYQARMAQRQMEQLAMQQLSQQQAVEDQSAAALLDKFGILDLVRNARQLPDRLAPGIDMLTGLNRRADKYLAPTMLPQHRPQAPMEGASVKPQSLIKALQSEARGASSAVEEKTDEAKRKAMAILRALQGAR